MKIRGRGELEQDTVTISRAGRVEAEQVRKDPPATPSRSAGEVDRVDLSLSRYISQEFNLEEIEQKRRARIEELKELIAKGEYNPRAEDVARAVTEEITLGVLTEGPRSS